MNQNVHNLVDLEDLSKEELKQLLDTAIAYQEGAAVPKLKRDVKVANLFFENSTRTVTSFQTAEHRLGLSRFDVNINGSSVKKGESLADTVKTVQAIGMDLTVIRHSETGWYKALEGDSNIHLSLVNAGDGAGVHPSQTLLDLMTIQKEFGDFSGLKIAIVGDLSHSRVAKSDAKIFKELGMQVYFAGPKEWWSEELAEYGQFEEIDNLLDQVDVLMCLRVQLERLEESGRDNFTADAYHEDYGLTKARAKRMKDTAIIMHPAPVNRGVEIDSELVDGAQSRIFNQMANGVYARMAILTRVLQEQGLMEEK
ncbi:aspartate carbamoyltransferase catalytic subunit [Fructobacillus sp. CRL 2054]|uniref:aspartate carbamoyltransferase catalytic subunit n=1 Tax=Fructobacillus sp. CRL 2054 TaxID=2763007 RepID=UPI0023783D04|nr:aspartate carbamoyltransferase catalytic subunit [Fructobacillus sp. CRL 2054]MDD9138637.1 aspartate carbamoyltransferase catalytic subunit [Fructobacillus sp. CRL 2054]